MNRNYKNSSSANRFKKEISSKAHIIIIILNEVFICMFLDQENCTKEATDDEAGSSKENFKDTKLNKDNKMVPFIFNILFL